MHRILIDDRVKAIADQYKQSMLSYKDKIFKSLNTFVEKYESGYPKLSIYIEKIEDEFDKILTLDVDSIPQTIKEFEAIIPDMMALRKINNKSLGNIIVDKLQYSTFCRVIMVRCIKELGIKACVNCNAQYAICTSAFRPEGLFDLDHYYPKSKYPYLSLSFYNLQPSCSQCNRKKSNKLTKTFCLYTHDKNELNPFSFKLDSRSLAEYILDGSDPAVMFSESEIKYRTLARNHDKIFNISGIYREHTDVIIELIWKYLIYNDSYRAALRNSFPASILPSDFDYERFMLGTYSKDEDINKRPLTKMMQDIGKELGIIRKE